MRSPSRLQPDLRQGAGAGADGQHDRPGLHRARLAVLQGDDDLGGALPLLQLRVALDDLDLVLLHQETDALIQLLGHTPRPGDDGLEVKAHLVGAQAVVLQVAQALVLLARLQQRLGGDAAPVQADAAEVLALDDGDLLAQLAGPDRGHIAARSRTDDDEIEVGHPEVSNTLNLDARSYPPPPPLATPETPAETKVQAARKAI